MICVESNIWRSEAWLHLPALGEGVGLLVLNRQPPQTLEECTVLPKKMSEARGCYLQLPSLGRVFGLLVVSGQIPWRDLIAYAMLPYGEGQFWTNASQHYRSFAVQFIAYALEASPVQILCTCLSQHAQHCLSVMKALPSCQTCTTTLNNSLHL